MPGRLIAVLQAEGTVQDARMADLVAAQRKAWHQHSEAKGLLTRAL
jgi:hypothetical protein